MVPLFFLRRKVGAHSRDVSELEVFAREHAQLGILGFSHAFPLMCVVILPGVLVLELAGPDLLIDVLKLKEAQRVMQLTRDGGLRCSL